MENSKMINIQDEKPMDISIIVPCKNEVSNLRLTLDSLKESKNRSKFEIIVVDDGSTDGSTDFLKSESEAYKDIKLFKTNNLGVSETKNFGASQASGKYLFFCDAHIRVSNGWLDELVKTIEEARGGIAAPCICDMNNTRAAGYGETWNNELGVVWNLVNPKKVTEIPIACGCCFGISTEAFEKINGFDQYYQVWGREDEEISLKAWLFGYKVLVNPLIKIQHLFRTKHPYQVTPDNVIYNTLWLAYSHFDKDRIKKTIDILKKLPLYNDAANKFDKDIKLVMEQRKKYFEERKYNDDYFFDKFNINL